MKNQTIGTSFSDQVRGLQARAIALKELVSFGEVQKKHVCSVLNGQIYAQKVKGEANLGSVYRQHREVDKSNFPLMKYLQKEKEVETLEKGNKAHKMRLEEHNDLFVERKRI